MNLAQNLISFNPRTYIRYDEINMFVNIINLSFNPRTYIRYDLVRLLILTVLFPFQSTYLYKVRPSYLSCCCTPFSFNPRTYIRYDGFQILFSTAKIRFNPRTYIRYDVEKPNHDRVSFQFQSTYLYKVRPQ